MQVLIVRLHDTFYTVGLMLAWLGYELADNYKNMEEQVEKRAELGSCVCVCVCVRPQSLGCVVLRVQVCQHFQLASAYKSKEELGFCLANFS